MPTYVYRCLQCDERFEVQQSFHDGPVSACRVCGRGPVKKVFTPVGVTFKGSGFYRTDSRTSGTKPAKTPASANGAESTSSTSTSEAAKPSSSTPAAATPSTSSSSDS
jgi:putative FmdB family regulatory protein